VRVAFLDGLLLEYRLPFLAALQKQVGSLGVFVAGRGFDLPDDQLQASGLGVSYLRSFSVNRTLRYPLGFGEVAPLDVPCNVLPMLSRFRPDVIISAEMGFRTLQAAAYRRMHPDCRLAVWARISEHSEASRGTHKTIARKALVRGVDVIVTNGSSGRRYLVRLGADQSRVHVIHQASALDVKPRSSRPGAPRRLLYVGRLVTSKGLHLLLATLARYRGTSWTLTVVGDGPEREQLRDFAAREHLPVLFRGFVPRAGLPDLFADHDVFVFPSLKDEWGLVVGEALRAGLPVVGSVYSEAVCEIVRDGITGWTMRPDMPESIIAALDRAFAATSEDLRRIGELAPKSAHRLTPEAMADRFAGVLHSMRASSPPAPRVVI
jgi:glycosyltransferase involved in cell wall biosynthesis